MFLCDLCYERTHNRRPDFWRSRSRGPCESCGLTSTCVDDQPEHQGTDIALGPMKSFDARGSLGVRIDISRRFDDDETVVEVQASYQENAWFALDKYTHTFHARDPKRDPAWEASDVFYSVYITDPYPFFRIFVREGKRPNNVKAHFYAAVDNISGRQNAVLAAAIAIVNQIPPEHLREFTPGNILVPISLRDLQMLRAAMVGLMPED